VINNTAIPSKSSNHRPALVGFLVWRRTPRAIAFETVFASAWIFALGFWITLKVLERFKPDLLQGLVHRRPADYWRDCLRCQLPAEDQSE
jgi:hypothetical protein